MPEYIVRWEINIEHDTPEEAALEAFNTINMPGTTATIFDVLDPEDESLIKQVDVYREAGGR